MNTLSPIQVRLLVVEPNPDIQGILREIFTEEGYDASFVPSMQEALSLVDKEVFQLILADLFVGRSKHSFTEAHILRRRALPTPTALMTTQNLLFEEVQRDGFVFLIHKPFDLEELLAEITRALQRPLTPEQQRQALLVERYFAALNERDWQGVADLCTEDVVYYPPGDDLPPSARKIKGKAAFCAHLEQLAQHMAFRIEEELVYPRRKGLAARYMNHAVGADSTTEHYTGAILFHFAGECIRQIAVSVNYEPLYLHMGEARVG
jgi:CheY-like chemotaxis protein/ketosteroid isomerase-like protein